MSSSEISALEPLVGSWRTEVVVDGEVLMRGEVTNEWIEDGNYLRVRSRSEPPVPEAPREWHENAPLSMVTIVGADDASGTLTALYSDARGVRRVQQWSVEDGVWRQWRDAEGFSQRFRGLISEDGDTIEGVSEYSKDGETWHVDLELIYRRAD